MQTPDGNQLNLDALYKICPSCFTESKDKEGNLKRVVDWAKLRALLGDNAVEDAPEVYDFTWVGKRAAQREAARPINKTLRPCPEESVDWDTTKNLYIEGDNLEVLKLLQNSYMGKVKMIYIDPPYNTGNDFVYHDDFAQSAEEYDEHNVDEEGNRFRKNTDSNGRFHSDWCSMMYSRLMVARSLLREDGVIFISIDDAEVENIRKISSEIFGTSNFVAQFIWKKKQGGGNDSAFVVIEHEYILCYAKTIENLKFKLDKKYKLDSSLYPNHDEKGDYGLITLDKASIQFSQSLVYEIIGPDGTKYTPRVVKGKQSCWRWGKRKVEEQYNDLVFKNGKVYTKYYKPEGVTPRSLLIDSIYGRTESGNDDISSLFDRNPFSYPKPVALIHHFISISTDNNDLILDFFSGSGTIAHAIIKLCVEDKIRRRYIAVQLQEETSKDSEAYKAGYKNICEIGKERIRRAGKKIKEEHPEAQDLDIGFRVLKCDESNMKDVYFEPKHYRQDELDFLEDNIKDDRTDLDLLFDCMLRWGVELSLPMTTTQVDGCTIHNVNDGDLLACFAGTITDKVISAIAAQHPLRIVFRDSSFTSASQKMNLFEQFKQLLSWSDQEVRNNVKVI